MALENIANEDMLFEFTNPPTGTPPPVPPDAAYVGDQGIDTVKIVPVLSPKHKALGKEIGTTSATIVWTEATGGCAFTSATHTFIGGGGSVSPSATKTRALGQLVLREGDNDTCTGSWTNDSTGATVVCTCKVEISDAGQTKVKAQ